MFKAPTSHQQNQGTHGHGHGHGRRGSPDAQDAWPWPDGFDGPRAVAEWVWHVEAYVPAAGWFFGLGREAQTLYLRPLWGGATGRVSVRPVCLLREVLGAGAAAVALAQRREAGGPEPAACDHKATRALERAAAAVGILLLDHVIVAPGGWFSFREAGGSPLRRWRARQRSRGRSLLLRA